MIEPHLVCVDCGLPASRRSGIFNKVYRCQECHAKMEKRNWVVALVGCGGCFGILALMMLLTSCGAAVAVMVAQ